MSDDIPVGSPPAPPGRHAAPGGWYPDPAHDGQERYWDGWQWTRNVRPTGSQPAPQQGYGRPGYGQPGYGGYQGDMQPGPYAQVHPGVPMGPRTEDGVPLSPYGWRVLAYLIDTVVLSIVGGLLGVITGLSARIQEQMDAYMAYIQEIVQTGQQLDFGRLLGFFSTPEQMVLNLLNALVFIAYSAWFLHWRGATLGKMACGLRVVPNGRGQHRGGLTWRESLIRPVATQVMDIVPLLSLVDLLFPLWDKRKQALHDKIARTQVVKIR